MTMFDREFNRLSDLLVHEIDPSVGYTREVITLNFADEEDVKMGTVVFRAKGVDPDAAYEKLIDASDLVATNEFAVVFGDAYGCKDEFPIEATTDTKAVAFVRGMVILKDYLPKLIHVTGGFDAADFETLRKLLKDQGVILEVAV